MEITSRVDDAEDTLDDAIHNLIVLVIARFASWGRLLVDDRVIIATLASGWKDSTGASTRHRGPSPNTPVVM